MVCCNHHQSSADSRSVIASLFAQTNMSRVSPALSEEMDCLQHLRFQAGHARSVPLRQAVEALMYEYICFVWRMDGSRCIGQQTLQLACGLTGRKQTRHALRWQGCCVVWGERLIGTQTAAPIRIYPLPQGLLRDVANVLRTRLHCCTLRNKTLSDTFSSRLVCSIWLFDREMCLCVSLAARFGKRVPVHWIANPGTMPID